MDIPLKIALFTSLLMVVSSLTAFGQEAQIPEKSSTITDISFIMIFSPTPETSISLTGARLLAPNSESLTRDMEDFIPEPYSVLSNTSRPMLQIGLSLKDKQNSRNKLEPLVRLGISYTHSFDLYYGTLSKDFPTSYDTLTYAPTGQITHVESYLSEDYAWFYSSDQLLLSSSLHIRTIQYKPISLLAGIGISGGVSINPFTQIWYSKVLHSDTTYVDGSIGSIVTNYLEDELEIHNNKTTFTATAFIPLGVELRFGNKTSILSRFQLFYQTWSVIRFTSIPEIPTRVKGLVEQGIGLRYSWD